MTQRHRLGEILREILRDHKKRYISLIEASSLNRPLSGSLGFREMLKETLKKSLI